LSQVLQVLAVGREASVIETFSFFSNDYEVLSVYVVVLRFVLDLVENFIHSVFLVDLKLDQSVKNISFNLNLNSYNVLSVLGKSRLPIS